MFPLIAPLLAGGGILITVLVILAIIALLVFILGRGRWR